MDNSAITKARPRRDDEFYTEYKDIAAEMRHYSLEVFRGKTILCPCDSPASAFVRYFKNRFEDLGLARLMAVSYTQGGKGRFYCFDGVQEQERELAGDGSFLSPEVQGLLPAVDLIITNPPFSRFSRDFFPWLMESGKGFIVMALNMAVIYQAVFHAYRAGKVWHGGEPPGILSFARPDGTQKKCGVCWLTNQPHDNRARTIAPARTYSPNGYAVYDDFLAINVDRLTDIPRGYEGLAGVPSTLAFFDGVDGVRVEPLAIIYPHIGGKKKFARFLCSLGAR